VTLIVQTQLIILVGLAIVLACALKKASGRTKPAWSQHLKGSEKVFGLIAFFSVVLIMINPEFLALGLLGDTAFFDMLVLALSLQMHMVVTQAWHRCATVLTRGVRWIGIPSLGLRYVLAVAALCIGSVVSFVQKVVHHLSS
jgi:hypothetical protein